MRTWNYQRKCSDGWHVPSEEVSCAEKLGETIHEKCSISSHKFVNSAPLLQLMISSSKFGETDLNEKKPLFLTECSEENHTNKFNGCHFLSTKEPLLASQFQDMNRRMDAWHDTKHNLGVLVTWKLLILYAHVSLIFVKGLFHEHYILWRFNLKCIIRTT